MSLSNDDAEKFHQNRRASSYALASAVELKPGDAAEVAD